MMEAALRRVLIVAILAAWSTVSPHAQWLRIPTAGIPRTADGKPNLTAPPPRTAEGRVSIAGLWRPTSRVIGDIAVGMKRGEAIPYQPWAESLYKERVAN